MRRSELHLGFLDRYGSPRHIGDYVNSVPRIVGDVRCSAHTSSRNKYYIQVLSREIPSAQTQTTISEGRMVFQMRFFNGLHRLQSWVLHLATREVLLHVPKRIPVSGNDQKQTQLMQMASFWYPFSDTHALLPSRDPNFNSR